MCLLWKIISECFVSPCSCIQDKWRNLSVSTTQRGSKDKSRTPKLKTITPTPLSNTPNSALAASLPHNASSGTVIDDPPNSAFDGKNGPQYVFLFLLSFLHKLCILYAYFCWSKSSLIYICFELDKKILVGNISSILFQFCVSDCFFCHFFIKLLYSFFIIRESMWSFSSSLCSSMCESSFIVILILLHISQVQCNDIWSSFNHQRYKWIWHWHYCQLYWGQMEISLFPTTLELLFHLNGCIRL